MKHIVPESSRGDPTASIDLDINVFVLSRDGVYSSDDPAVEKVSPTRRWYSAVEFPRDPLISGVSSTTTLGKGVDVLLEETSSPIPESVWEPVKKGSVRIYFRGAGSGVMTRGRLSLNFLRAPRVTGSGTDGPSSCVFSFLISFLMFLSTSFLTLLQTLAVIFLFIEIIQTRKRYHSSIHRFIFLSACLDDVTELVHELRQGVDRVVDGRINFLMPAL